MANTSLNNSSNSINLSERKLDLTFCLQQANQFCEIFAEEK